MLRAICTLLSLGGLLGASMIASAAPIQIESGTYGANCGAHRGNATRELAQHCNAVDTCRFSVAAPATFRAQRACKADFVAEWTCGPGAFHQASVRSAANNRGVLVLTCIPPTGAGK